MPTVIEAAQQLASDGLPVLCVDTCILLDVIRTPLRTIPGSIQSAIELAELAAQSGCRIVMSSVIKNEWENNEQAVMTELDRHLAIQDKHALAFHEACALANVPLSFNKPSYQAAGLAAKLRELSAELLNCAVHLSPSDEAKSKAYDRTLACVRPARKGGGLGDCTILEEYLELCRLLQAGGFSKQKAFCTSNTKDYQDGGKLHQSLASEFGTVGLVFTNALHWAVHEIKKS